MAEWPGGKPKPQQPGPSQAPAQQYQPRPHEGPSGEYYAPPQPSSFGGISGNDVAGKAIEAYRINPMLTGLLFLNLAIFVGAGWYLNVVQDRTAMYVKARDNDLKELQNRALDMAAKCIVPDTFQQRSYPQPQPYYPQYSPAPAPAPSYQQPSPPPPAPAPQPQAIVPAAPRQSPFKQ